MTLSRHAAILFSGMLMATSAISMNTAFAQEAAAPQAAITSEQVDGTVLDAFVVAFVEVNTIGQTYAQQMQAATTPDEQAQIQGQASSEMMAAIEEVEGIEVDQYNEILTVAQTDTELAERINTRLQAMAAAPQ